MKRKIIIYSALVLITAAIILTVCLWIVPLSRHEKAKKITIRTTLEEAFDIMGTRNCRRTGNGIDVIIWKLGRGEYLEVAFGQNDPSETNLLKMNAFDISIRKKNSFIEKLFKEKNSDETELVKLYKMKKRTDNSK